MTPAHVKADRLVLLIVGADIQHNGKGIRRTNAAAGGNIMTAYR